MFYVYDLISGEILDEAPTYEGAMLIKLLAPSIEELDIFFSTSRPNSEVRATLPSGRGRSIN